MVTKPVWRIRNEVSQILCRVWGNLSCPSSWTVYLPYRRFY